MTKSDQRRILDMLAEGKITAEEAEQLLKALGTSEEGKPGPGAGEARPGEGKVQAKYLRVIVQKKDGEDLANLRVPLRFLRAGMKLASVVPGSVGCHVVSALNQEGIKVDLEKLKPEDLEELVDQLSDTSINVAADGESVRIFCE